MYHIPYPIMLNVLIIGSVESPEISDVICVSSVPVKRTKYANKIQNVCVSSIQKTKICLNNIRILSINENNKFVRLSKLERVY